MLNKVWFRTGIFLIILFVLIKLFMEVHSVFTPIATIIGSVFLPFLLSGFLFYICLPFQTLLEKWGFPRWASILTIFIVLIAIIAIVVAFIAPIIISNVNNLIKATPTLQRDAEQVVNFSLNQMDKLPRDVTAKINSTMKSISDSLTYTPLLVLFAGVANLIPFLGPWLSFAPAAILGIIDGPSTFIWVCVVTLIAQQLEGNVITPNVMGKSLSIHPLTIIVVILAAGDLGGFTLILIAVPLYAVLKTVARNVFKYRQRIIDKANSDVKD